MSSDVEGLLKRLGRLRRMLLEVRGGGKLHLVGGSVRDVLLGREPADLDFAVSGSGLRFARDFAARVPGKLVVLSEEDDEVRVVCGETVLDFNGYGEGTIEDDLVRRDFTVNALGCEVLPRGVGEIADPADGRSDLERRVIRPVSSSALASDPLRLLRAIRLALELDFEVADSVWRQGRAVTLARTAAERIGTELLRVMEQPGSHQYLLKLGDMGKLAELLPELRPLLDDEKLRLHSLRTYHKLEEMIGGGSFFARFEPEWTKYFERWDAESDEDAGLPHRRALLKLSGLLHDIAKPETKFETDEGDVHFYGHDSLGARKAARIAQQRLRLSRAQIRMVQTLVQEHMRLHLLATSRELTDRAIRRFFRDLGNDAFGMMMLCYADGWATAGRTEHLEDTVTRMIAQKRDEDEKSRVMRFVTGHDLIALGLKPGPAFKVILQELEDLQLEGTIGTKEEGVEYLKTNLPGLMAGAAE